MFPPEKVQLRRIECLNAKRDTVHPGGFEAGQFCGLHRGRVGLGGDFDICGKAKNLLGLGKYCRDQIWWHQAWRSPAEEDAAQLRWLL